MVCGAVKYKPVAKEGRRRSGMNGATLLARARARERIQRGSILHGAAEVRTYA